MIMKIHHTLIFTYSCMIKNIRLRYCSFSLETKRLIVTPIQ